MTPVAYRVALRTLGLSPGKAAVLLQVNRRLSRRWISGARPVPARVGEVLTILVREHERDPASATRLIEQFLPARTA